MSAGNFDSSVVGTPACQGTHNFAGTGSPYGVAGWATAATAGYGVIGGGWIGVFGTTSQSNGTAVQGFANASWSYSGWFSGGYGVHVESPSTYGIYVKAQTGTTPIAGYFLGAKYGIYAENTQANQPAIYGYSNTGVAGYFSSNQCAAVQAYTGPDAAVYAYNSAANVPTIHARCSNMSSPEAGLFEGDVNVYGYIFKTGGGWKIDHPTKPETHFLVHQFVESNKPKNVYDGVVALDANGTATVQLPDYFSDINKDPVPKVSAVGCSQPNLWASVTGNALSIGGGAPFGEVAWEVSATRNDAFTRARPVGDVVEKAPRQKGRFLHPELHGSDRRMHDDPPPCERPAPDTNREAHSKALEDAALAAIAARNSSTP